MKSLVISLKDSNHVCTFSLRKGIISPIVSDGCDPAYVLRMANATLAGSVESIVAECERAFNINGSEYVGSIEPTRRGEIVDAGNGLPYTGDLVYSCEANTVYRIAHCSRVQANANGKGNSMDVTLIEAGSPDDYTESAFDDILDCRVDLEEEI